MAAQSEFRNEVEKQRPYLVRYASLQLRDADLVQDVVQETLLAALSGEGNFAGRSNLRTWLTGILKHKIVDAIRRASRETTLAADAEGEEGDFDALFRQGGHWVEHPAAWNNPDASLEQRQFFAVLEECLTKLPEKTAQAFLMREHLGSDTDEICKSLAITPSHCWVMLHRARMALRLCLEGNWFGK
ncbi:MAG: sigma-70 family RNA polymerase sigma factor [Burkholderiales bacterium]